MYLFFEKEKTTKKACFGTLIQDGSQQLMEFRCSDATLGISDGWEGWTLYSTCLSLAVVLLPASESISSRLPKVMKYESDEVPTVQMGQQHLKNHDKELRAKQIILLCQCSLDYTY